MKFDFKNNFWGETIRLVLAIVLMGMYVFLLISID